VKKEVTLIKPIVQICSDSMQGVEYKNFYLDFSTNNTIFMNFNYDSYIEKYTFNLINNKLTCNLTIIYINGNIYNLLFNETSPNILTES